MIDTTERVELEQLQTPLLPDDRLGRGAQRTRSERLAVFFTTPAGRLMPTGASVVAIGLFFASQSSVFLTSENLVNLASQISVTCLIALALSLVVIARQIDLSLSVLAAVCGGVAARLTVSSHWGVVLAIAVALLAGAASGAVQSAIAMALEVPTFIVTLGGYFVLGALLLWLIPTTGVIPLAGTPLESIAQGTVGGAKSYALIAVFVAISASLRWGRYRASNRASISTGGLLRAVILPVAALAGVLTAVVVLVFNRQHGIPTPFVIAVSLIAVVSYVTTQTPLGPRLYAIGANPEAARRAGLHVKRFTIAVFAVSGALTGLAGVILASRQLGVAPQTSDFTVLLDALAAVVIGGISLNGGIGSVWAALTGSLVIGSIDNGLFLITASTQVRWAVEGAVLIAAVAVDALLVRKARTLGRAR